MAPTWFYIDANGMQVGPVSADELRALVRRGALSPASMAWSEGMSSWAPIDQLASQLQLDPLPEQAFPVDGRIPPAFGNPYQSPEASGTPSQYRASSDVVYAGFWRRVAARVLDHFIVFIPIYILTLVVVGGVAGLTRVESGDAAPALLLSTVYLLPLLANFFYFSLMESSSWQATLGKRALGIKVTDADGRRLSFPQAAGRWVAASLSYLTFYIGFAMAGLTERKRALHDMLASTLVVDQWAYTDSPERQQRSMSGCLIVFIVLFVGGLFVVPIFAAIAISQYQDYVLRSQVSEGAALADGVKTAYAEYVQNRGTAPPSNEAAGLPAPREIHGAYVAYVDLGSTPGRIEVGYSSQAPLKANKAIDGKHLLFDAVVSGASVQWQCHSEDLRQKWCPSSCDCSG
jgi:uncharacterized RDD family membrane protein YckC/Tfp pilus assembly protein PilE